MEKVIVNKVVAGWIENIKFELAPGCKHEKHILLRNLMADRANQLGGLDIDIVTLAKAIQYGYEVPYEFKVGDIVGEITELSYKHHFEVTSCNLPHIKNNPSIRLVCRAEKREDLKEVSNG